MAGLESLASDTAPFFLYQSNAVAGHEARALLQFLDTIPERDDDQIDATSEFVFVRRPSESGGLGRAEAVAGEPIWLGTAWGRGVDIPSELIFLQQRVSELATDIDFRELLGFTPNLTFTSIYVDRYLPGGGFFRHTDGDRYGEVIAGVSIGPGSASLAFWSDDHQDSSPEIELTVEPNSIYIFCGPIRHSPWQHAVRGVTDLRYGITWRTAPEL